MVHNGLEHKYEAFVDVASLNFWVWCRASVNGCNNVVPIAVWIDWVAHHWLCDGGVDAVNVQYVRRYADVGRA